MRLLIPRKLYFCLYSEILEQTLHQEATYFYVVIIIIIILDQGLLYSMLRVSDTFTPVACSHRLKIIAAWWQLCLRQQAVHAAFPVLEKKKEYHSLSVLNYFDLSAGGSRDISYAGLVRASVFLFSW